MSGPRLITRVRKDPEDWIEQNEWPSLTEMRGNMSVDKIPNPQACARTNYMMMLQSWDRA